MAELASLGIPDKGAQGGVFFVSGRKISKKIGMKNKKLNSAFLRFVWYIFKKHPFCRASTFFHPNK
jgi:hypothetical protein